MDKLAQEIEASQQTSEDFSVFDESDYEPVRERFTVIHVVPGSARCVRHEVTAGRDQYSVSVPPGTGAYVNGRVNNAGQVVSARVLYSAYPKFNQDLERLLKENFSVVSIDTATDLEFFGYVGVFDNDELGYAFTTLARTE